MSDQTVRCLVPVVAMVAAGLAMSVSPVLAKPAAAPAATAPAGKKVVRTADDLPRHTYKIEGKASAMFDDPKAIDKLLVELKRDIEADLAGYDIQDRTTLQGYLTALQSIALLQGREAEALGYTDRIRDLETKEGEKLMSGLVQRALAAGRAAPEGQVKEVIARELDKQLRVLPFDKIREIIAQRKSQMQMVTPDLVRGQLTAQLDPVIAAAGGEVSGEIARQLVRMAVAMRLVLPHREVLASVYGKLLDDNTGEAKDIWVERDITLPADGLKPVTIAVWDSGVDTKVLPSNLWVNAGEQANGKDDDGNGFIDDVNGIAYDLDAKPSSSLLFPMNNLKTSIETLQKHSAGISDMQANIDSPEAKAAREYIGGLKGEAVGQFLEDMGQWGNYMHGTHVAGITAVGNPAARILAARLEFDYRNIPLHAPTVERARAEAAAAKATVDYFKAKGVRVVNMSWGGSRQDIERALEEKGVGGTPEERAKLAREIFGIGKDALEQAIRSAPEILFIAAAGNSNNDAQFSEMIPSGLSVPNLITIGAVDQSGKPTGFTSFGSNVQLYASGYRVDSFIPGGGREKASGTSMAAPQVANLAGKLLAINPALKPADLIGLITSTSDPMPGNNQGRLIINPKAAVAKARSK